MRLLFKHFGLCCTLLTFVTSLACQKVSHLISQISHLNYNFGAKLKSMDLKNYKGVLHGDQVQELFEAAKKHQFALPAVNVTGTNTINAVMETAKAVNSPVIIQLSNGGAQFYAGKSLDNSKLQACILGGVSAAKHVHLLAEHYGVAVILHTDHAAMKVFTMDRWFVGSW